MDAIKDKYENLIDRMSHYLTKAFRNSKIDYDFEIKNIEGATFISPDKSQNIYLIFKEAITNILKHSVGDKVRINLVRYNDELILTIYDNGNNVKLNNSGQGIQNMKNRSKSIGGMYR